MAIITTGASVVFRYSGRSVSVNKNEIRQRGQETKDDAESRVRDIVRGSDRECEIDLGPPVVYWQGPVGAVRHPLVISIPKIVIP